MSSADIRVINPFDGSCVGTVPSMEANEVRDKVRSCAAVSESLPAHERAACLRRAARSIQDAAEDWARLITLESGLSLRDTQHEVARALEVLEWGAVEAVSRRGETWMSDVARGHANRVCCSFSGPMPGVVLVVTPFNHPLNQVAHKIVPAVAAGARVLLKPSEKTPLTAVRFVEQLHTAGLPADQVQIITGDPRVLVKATLGCSEVTGLAFTGSTRVGRELGYMAGPRRISLELGSIDSAIILDSADIEVTAKAVLRGAFANSGQRCTAVKRIVVVEEIADSLMEAMADHMPYWRCGDPLDRNTLVGTVIDAQAAQEAVAVVESAVRSGARILTGGVRDGALVHPTLIDRCRIGMPLVDREVFAPIAPVIRVKDLEGAIAAANAGPYGLSCGVFTQSMTKAARTVKEVRTGSVNINEVPGWRLEVTPFGGIGDSGIGVKEGIARMIDFFQFERVVSFDGLHR